MNTNGNANNNNARNSNGLAPDFVSQKWFGSIIVACIRVNHDLYERRNASRDYVRNCPLMLLHERRRETERAWRGICLNSFHVYPAKQIRRHPTRYLYGGRKIYFVMSRRKGRYERRQAKREANKIKRCQEVGGLNDVFTYHDMIVSGRKCCNGVRWKNSAQRFELHLFSGTAKRRREILEQKWKPSKYVHFTISERGKTRPIDAPCIQDRQMQKVLPKRSCYRCTCQE